MTDEEHTGSCPTCGLRDPRHPLICDADRSKLHSWLREIPELLAELEETRFEPSARADVSGKVSGSRERRLPIRVDPTDLLGPLRSVRTVYDEALVPKVHITEETEWQVALFDGKEVRQEVRRREVVRGAAHPVACRCGRRDLHPDPGAPVMVPAGDRAGFDSVASELDFWVRDWREARGGKERLPDPEVATLASWLDRRADDAADGHPAIDEMFGAIRRIRLTLLGQLGKFDVPDYKRGVPCRRCDALTLVRHNGSDWIECGSCPELLSPDEYERWCGLLAAAAKEKV